MNPLSAAIVSPVFRYHRGHANLVKDGLAYVRAGGYLRCTPAGVRLLTRVPDEHSAPTVAAMHGYYVRKRAFGRVVPWSTEVIDVQYEVVARDGIVYVFATLEEMMLWIGESGS